MPSLLYFKMFRIHRCLWTSLVGYIVYFFAINQLENPMSHWKLLSIVNVALKEPKRGSMVHNKMTNRFLSFQQIMKKKKQKWWHWVFSLKMDSDTIWYKGGFWVYNRGCFFMSSGCKWDKRANMIILEKDYMF